MSEREVYRDGEPVAEGTAEACAEACGIDPWTVYVRKADPHDREGWAARHGKGWAVRREDALTGEEVVLSDEMPVPQADGVVTGGYKPSPFLL